MGRARARQEITGLTLDAGALIAVERGNGRMIALLRKMALEKRVLHIPAPALGQAWRGGERQVLLARLVALPEVSVVPLDELQARACGALCGVTHTSDVIDASIVLCAHAHGDRVITSDVRDLKRIDPSLDAVQI